MYVPSPHGPPLARMAEVNAMQTSRPGVTASEDRGAARLRRGRAEA